MDLEQQEERRRGTSPCSFLHRFCDSVLGSLHRDDLLLQLACNDILHRGASRRIFLSFIANLAFEWAWNVTIGRSDKSRRVPSQVTMETTVPLLGETEDSKSLPIPPAEDYISEQATKPKETVDYINNIKIFLTVMVIIFHCAEKQFDQM